MLVSKKMGQDIFRWWIGVVEDREDPLKLGRVRVRVHYVHATSKTAMPTESLPWAIVMTPAQSASNKEVGTSPNGLVVGATVIGFFADGPDMQLPIVLGTYAGIPSEGMHDVAKPAREINNITKSQLGPEPSSAYAAKYPYNKVTRTEGGHVIEIDDTPGAERIHVYHKSGTYDEINSEGRQVRKVVGDDYEIVAGKQEVYIQGNVNVVVKGNVNITTIDGTYTIKSKGRMVIESEDSITMKAPVIDLNP